jgi:DNA (cytosine-5)-methyltransferase 1
VAGGGAGINEDTRSGLWSEYARLVGEIRPKFIIVENVSALLGRGLDRVLGDLAQIGYDAEWHCIPASALGAPHRRDRIWIVAYPSSTGLEGQWNVSGRIEQELRDACDNRGWIPEPNVGRVANGVPSRSHRLKCLGNAVIPQIPEIIGRAIMSVHNQGEHP